MMVKAQLSIWPGRVLSLIDNEYRYLLEQGLTIPGTLTIPAPGMAIWDDGDGTVIFTDQSVTDNGDGSLSFTDWAIVDQGDGSLLFNPPWTIDLELR